MEVPTFVEPVRYLIHTMIHVPTQQQEAAADLQELLSESPFYWNDLLDELGTLIQGAERGCNEAQRFVLNVSLFDGLECIPYLTRLDGIDQDWAKEAVENVDRHATMHLMYSINGLPPRLWKHWAFLRREHMHRQWVLSMHENLI